MIGWLRGELIARERDGEVLVDVAGVGYRVVVPGAVMSGLGDVGSDVSLFVHTHVREDAIVLYGFTSAYERRCFEALIAAHGVGPSLALSVMSSLRPDALVRAVVDNDLDLLCAVPGIGRKTAARLVLDLKSKLDVTDEPVLPSAATGGSDARGEVRAALAELGYNSDEIRRALAALPEAGSVEELLRVALRELAVAGSRS